MKDQESIDKYKDRFPTEDGTVIGKYLQDDLLKNDWVRVNDVTKRMTVTDKFRAYFIKDEDALNELIDIYPPFVTKGEVRYPLVTVDKFQYGMIYGRRIFNSIDEHNEVLLDLAFGVENNYITFGIGKFIDGEIWKVLRKIRLGDPDALLQLDLYDEDF
tara:strand:- start:43185 stop:43661 length:477 start_codon:yes stop_codon:yes gene_type:complete